MSTANPTRITDRLVCEFQQNMPGLDSFVQYASWDEIGSQPLKTWSCSPKLQLLLGEGSGQLNTPFSIRSQEFISICAEFGFSDAFLQKFVAKTPLFEYRFVMPKPPEPQEIAPSHLEIMLATFEIDGFFCLLRYELSEQSSKVILFSKTMDCVRKQPFLNSDLIL
jgi:hypothetical protein